MPWAQSQCHGRNAKGAMPMPWAQCQCRGRNAKGAMPMPWAQCQCHGRNANAMGAMPMPWAQCQCHGRNANDNDTGYNTNYNDMDTMPMKCSEHLLFIYIFVVFLAQYNSFPLLKN
jgi:hypothetical protein